MIQEKTYTRDWVMGKSIEYMRGKRKADPTLIEKVTKAFHLLEELAKTNLKFVFKGGTSLLLLLSQLHRFSIDIDVIVDEHEDEENLNAFLTEVIRNSPVFNRYKKQTRASSSKIPKTHYKFYYFSILDNQESAILLDVVFDKNHYLEIGTKRIDCRFLACEEPIIHVAVPSIDCILGDKLTAFAPNTTGIPFGQGKELDIIKQLFDVENLFDEMRDINIVSETFFRIAQQELTYRELTNNLTTLDVLGDIFNTSRILSERGRIDKEVFDQLQQGISRIKEYVFSRNLILETAINSASKAAYLSLLLKYGITDYERFDSKLNLRDFVIKNPDFRSFKTIMNFDPESYFYWFKSIEILNSRR